MSDNTSVQPHPGLPFVRGNVDRWLGRYQIVLWTSLILVGGSTLLRLVLLFAFADTSSLGPGQWLQTFWVGFRFDLLVAMVFQLPQVIHMTITGNMKVIGRFSRFQIHAGLFVTFAAMLFVLSAEYCFFEEFDSRLNYIAFEYLVYPTEVLTNIWQSYPLVPILAAVAALAGLLYWPMRGMTRRSLAVPLPLARRLGWLGGWVAVAAVLWLTTGLSSMAVSPNRVVNQCAGNGVWTFVQNAWTSRFDYGDFYPTLAEDMAQQNAAAAVFGAGDLATAHPMSPLDRVVETGRPRRDYNVILVLEESLGSDFVGVLGDDRGLTPNLDRLSNDALLLDNFYATGNRTARALEATLTGLPPIPTESILKRDHSDHVESLARILHDRGYQTRFVYGGRGLFDGMRPFMLANGFEQFVEESDYKDPGFTNAWGVSDEAIFDRALEECDQMYAADRPFFTTVLTVSNHQPFTYPDGRIDCPSDENRRENAVKYADYAVGRFIDQAKGHRFFDETMIVVLGDHGARVYGAQQFPLKSYRVPVWVFLPHGEKAGERSSVMSCSLDIAPTILGQLGGRYRTVMFGRDALAADAGQGRALMQHNHDLALLRADGRMTVLSLSAEPSTYLVDPASFEAKQIEVDDEEVNTAVSLFQSANDLYYADRYRVGGVAGEALTDVARP